jgi:hypothetical protein
MKKQAFLIMLLAFFCLAGFSQTVVTQNTGLMAEPSLTSKRVTTAYEGDQVTLIEKSGEFWKITCNKKTGFIHGSCLSNYVNPNIKGQEEAVAGKAVAGQAVTVPAFQDTSMIVTGPRNQLYYKGKLLKAADLKALLITNPEAKEKWQTRNVLYVTGLVLAGTGGGVVGSSLGSGEVGLVLIGVAIAGAGIGVAALSGIAQQKAISIFNLGVIGKPGSVSLRLGAAQHGYGLTLNF